MRKPFDPQQVLDRPAIPEVKLNFKCRTEIIPILAGLQHIYSQPKVRDEILELVAGDANGAASAKRGRTGMDYWEIVVLASVKLGCNFDYDTLQDLAENHRTLQQMMGIGDWEVGAKFDFRRIRDNICLLSPETIRKISEVIVAEGHKLVPDAAKSVRGDAFVVETNVHHPTDSSLIGDGLRKILLICAELSFLLGAN